MATPVERRLRPKQVRRFGSGRNYELPPDLTKIQTASYASFLQIDTDSTKRKSHGIEGVLNRKRPARNLSNREL